MTTDNVSSAVPREIPADEKTEIVAPSKPSSVMSKRHWWIVAASSLALIVAFTLIYHRHNISDWFKTDFGEVRFEDGLITENGKNFSGTLQARGNDVFALGQALFVGTPMEEELTYDTKAETKGLIVEIEVKDGRAQGEAVVYADLRSDGFQWRLPDDVGFKLTLAKWFFPRLEIARANFDNGKLNGKAEVSRPSGSSLSLAPLLKVEFVNNQPNGALVVFHKDGSVKTEMHFNHGERDGAHREYFPGGVIEVEGSYLAGQRQGLWKEYYLDGKVREETLYDEFGERKSATSWYPNGVKGSSVDFQNLDAAEHYWSNGEPRHLPPNGEIHTYHPTGAVRSTIRYVDGTKEGPFTMHYEDGQLWEEGSYRNGVLVGSHKKWWKDGSLALEEEYSESGLRQGKMQRWYANGNLWETATYVNGEEQGEYRKYWKNGELAHKYSFVDGQIDGKYQTFHDNGQAWELGEYREGKRIGEFQKWYANGALRLKTSYQEGRLHGEFLNYLDDGSVYEIATYENGDLIQSSRQ